MKDPAGTGSAETVEFDLSEEAADKIEFMARYAAGAEVDFRRKRIRVVAPSAVARGVFDALRRRKANPACKKDAELLGNILEAGACPRCQTRSRRPKKRYCSECAALVKKAIKAEIPIQGSQRVRDKAGSANPKLGGDPSPAWEDSVRRLEG